MTSSCDCKKPERVKVIGQWICTSCHRHVHPNGRPEVAAKLAQLHEAQADPPSTHSAHA